MDPVLFPGLVWFQVDAWILRVRRPDNRIPVGQEHPVGAGHGRGRDYGEGTTFAAADISDADEG